MTNKEAIENTNKVWVIKNGDYSVVEVYQKDIGLFTQFFETKEEAEKIAEEYKQAEKNEKKEIEGLKGTMTNAEAIKAIKSLVETLDDYAFYTPEDKVAFYLAIKALEREEGWISVKDRLPKGRDWYLGIFKERKTGWINPIPFVCDYVGHETPYTTSDFWILGRLTDTEKGDTYYKDLVCVAWQPLPEPYKEEQKCGEICGDNRFEIIAEAKKHLLEATNIETSKDEMACLDSFLFRCWQMGWLKQYERAEEEENDKNGV